MRHLHTKSIGIMISVICLAQVCMLALFAWYNYERVNKQTREQVESTARMVGENYVNRSVQIALTASSLAASSELANLIKTDSRLVQERYLTQIAPQGEGEFVAIVDANDVITSSVKGIRSSVDLDKVEAQLKELGLQDGSAVLALTGNTYTVHVKKINQRGLSHRVAVGFDPQTSLSNRLNGVIGGDASQWLKVSVFVGNGIVPASGDQKITLPLDTSGANELGATIDFSNSLQDSTMLSFLKKFGVQAFAIFSLCSLLASMLINSLLRKTIRAPVHAVRKAIHGLIKGKFENRIETISTAPFDNISHDLETMREAIFDRESRIMHHAEYDALTGLTNRSVISDKLKVAMSRAKRNDTIITALAIDLSRFSEINGSLGHEVGDAVLKEIARRLASNARVTDTVARIGGDEFFIILEDQSVELAQQLAKFMVSSLLSPIVVNGNEIKLSVHSGVAFYPKHSDSSDALRRMASIALYTSKETKTSFMIYEPGQDEKHLRELAIIHDLPNAIKNNELYLQYQPKIDMETQQVNQVEALVRWRHPQLGFIPPDEFIALLEKAGLIGRLTDWVFKEAIKQVRDWVEGGYDLGVAVNISANDLADEQLPQRIKLLLHHYLVKPSSITVEVTESAVIKDPENSVKILNELRKAGIKISLDDFGTGQTSLALLKQLPISEIKIDKSFVQNLRADSGDAIIVKSIIDLGHNMGLHVIAEGVESNYCWNLLNSYGCNLVQGYLVSAPLTADELGEWQLRLQDRHVNKLDLSFVHDMTG